MPRQDLIALRRGTASAWTSANPILASGEQGFETDTNKLKIGDGSTVWNSLDYIAGDATVSSVNGETGDVILTEEKIQGSLYENIDVSDTEDLDFETYTEFVLVLTD